MTWDTARFWEERYAAGNHSGRGSRGEAGLSKATYVNKIISAYGVTSVIDWGVGDGAVLSHIVETINYTGIDVSPTAVRRLRRRMGHRGRFLLAGEAPADLTAEMALSLDVIYHLITDNEYKDYMHRLFGSARRLVLIHSSNHAEQAAPHVRHRHFTPDVGKWFGDWALTGIAFGPTSGIEFRLYGKRS